MRYLTLLFKETSKKHLKYKELLDLTISVQSQSKYQTILGFGGAFTDAVGENLKSLSKKTQKKLIDSYFSNTGILF